MYKKSILIFSRAKHYKKGNKTYFQNLDGPYIDKISSIFTNVTILSRESIKETSNINYEMNLKNIINFPTKNRIQNIFYMFQLIKKNDIIYVFMPLVSSFIAILMAKLLGKKCIIYTGFPWKDITSNKIKRVLLNSFEYIIIKIADLVLINNNQLFEKFKGYSHIERTKPLTIITKESFFYNPRVLQKSNTIDIVSIGHIMPRKGFDLAIEAINILNNQYDFKYHIVGIVSDKQYYRYLLKLIAKYNLKDKIIFTGYKNHYEIIKLMRKSDFFIMSSLSEGFPRVIWESMSQSLPVITSNLANIVNELNNGSQKLVFFKSKNYKDLSEKIDLLINNQNIYYQLIENAFKYVNTIFDEKPEEQFLRLFEGIVYE